MAQIYGQIDSLKQIRNRLNLKGIDRFNSLNEFNTFLDNYESEKATIYKQFENELDNDIHELKETIKYSHVVLENIINENAEKLDAKINLNQNRIDKYSSGNKKTFIRRVFTQIIINSLNKRVKYLQHNYEKIINKSIKKNQRKIRRDTELLDDFVTNRHDIVSKRSALNINQLAYIKDVVLELNPLIAGAIGENLVVNEIKKLSDDYTLINDFSLIFNPPIYNRKKDDRIFSIQIDHLLISKSGVYILETKNWSRKSILSSEIRSPIEQINRNSFALFLILKNKNIKLDNHHWGKKQIPIRSIVVMINQKPEDEFEFVKVKTLKELNSYIEFFDPIFNDDEFNKISKYLIDLNEE